MPENENEAQTPAPQEEMPFYKAAMAKAELAQAMEISAVPPYSTVSEILQKKKAQLEYELKVVNDALDSVNDALDKAQQQMAPRG